MKTKMSGPRCKTNSKINSKTNSKNKIIFNPFEESDNEPRFDPYSKQRPKRKRSIWDEDEDKLLAQKPQSKPTNFTGYGNYSKQIDDDSPMSNSSPADVGSQPNKFFPDSDFQNQKAKIRSPPLKAEPRINKNPISSLNSKSSESDSGSFIPQKQKIDLSLPLGEQAYQQHKNGHQPVQRTAKKTKMQPHAIEDSDESDSHPKQYWKPQRKYPQNSPSSSPGTFDDEYSDRNLAPGAEDREELVSSDDFSGKRPPPLYNSDTDTIEDLARKATEIGRRKLDLQALSSDSDSYDNGNRVPFVGGAGGQSKLCQENRAEIPKSIDVNIGDIEDKGAGLAWSTPIEPVAQPNIKKKVIALDRRYSMERVMNALHSL